MKSRVPRTADNIHDEEGEMTARNQKVRLALRIPAIIIFSFLAFRISAPAGFVYLVLAMTIAALNYLKSQE